MDRDSKKKKNNSVRKAKKQLLQKMQKFWRGKATAKLNFINITNVENDCKQIFGVNIVAIQLWCMPDWRFFFFFFKAIA